MPTGVTIVPVLLLWQVVRHIGVGFIIVDLTLGTVRGSLCVDEQ